jgi:hypothetical protein
MRSVLALFMIIFTCSVRADDAKSQWTLEVLFPDKELKTFQPGEAKFEIPLSQKVGWKCVLEPTNVVQKDERLQVEKRYLTCSTDGKNGMMALGVCLVGSDYNSPIAINLISGAGGKGEAVTVIKASCK